MPRTAHLSELVGAYRKAKEHWYLFPRAAYINEKNVKELHDVLRLFGKFQWMKASEVRQQELEFSRDADPNALVLRPWTQGVQREIQKLMVAEGLIRPRRKESGRVADYLANVRNHWNLLKKLGFAHVNRLGHLFISDAGHAFLNTSDRNWPDIFERQLVRLQFWNTSIESRQAVKRYQGFSLYPYLFTLNLLLGISREGVSTLEFTLFVDSSKTMDDLESVKARILTFRALPREAQRKVKRLARPTFPHLANASVTMGFFGYTPAMQFREGRLFLRDRKRAERLLTSYWNILRHIEYESFADWFSRMGRMEVGPTAREAVVYYTEIGRPEAAETVVRVVDDVVEKANLEEELSRLLKERLIEETLEKNPDLVEAGLVLVPNGRQYTTDVTRVDLLAKDRQGVYVIVELKRGRTEDEAVGQTLRYMGWVRENLAGGRPVRGVIIVSDEEITQKLEYAIKGAQSINPSVLLLKHMPISVKAQIKEAGL